MVQEYQVVPVQCVKAGAPVCSEPPPSALAIPILAILVPPVLVVDLGANLRLHDFGPFAGTQKSTKHARVLKPEASWSKNVLLTGTVLYWANTKLYEPSPKLY